MATKLQNLGSYISARSKELTTWQGVVLAVSAIGWHLKPELQDFILMAGPGIGALMSIVLPSKWGGTVDDSTPPSAP
jgi:hypothetical protein